MDVDRTTVPGQGTVHHLLTRSGSRFALVAGSDGSKQVLVYDRGGDEPARTISLDADEADQLADLLHSAPIPDRIARLERLMDQFTGERSRS
ncbi:hypothetical protein IU485_00020 [Nocardia cyriacigeorgica]|uniref:hypothetical protein n=1 Tax=Nocardia cyriacigeorgica TaxID=135487 RepID=UPI00189375C8|nr:hypothetical protein [Nocardia cyriacigeorgica]MBF6079743.1 hypothetical protein [Nocardia cyriacigeorgica]